MDVNSNSSELEFIFVFKGRHLWVEANDIRLICSDISATPMCSVSRGPLNLIVSNFPGIDTTPRGLLAVDEQGRTSQPGIFASGDVVNGARTVVEAVAFSKRVAAAMDEYIQNLPKE